MYLSKIGFNNNKLILKSLLLSKFLHVNLNSFPNSDKLKIIFPLFDSAELTKSKIIIIILNFLEEFVGCKSLITHTKILIKKGVFFRCQIILTKHNYNQFLGFFNNFILTNTLLKFANKPIKLTKINKNTVNLIMYDIDFFFDAYTRRLLPNSKFFWFELEFIFKNKFLLIDNSNLELYTQLFFCHNIFEWYLK